MSKPILITAPVGNNPARCRMLIYYKGLEDHIEMKSPADYGGLSSPEYRKINPQGKMPALILPTGDVLYEANVVAQYINDKYSDIGPHVGASTPEERARAALLTQVHDLYIASPNSSDPKVTANQGAMYKPVDVIDAASRAGKLAELNKQLDVIEGLLVGPFAAGEQLTLADFTMFPTLGVFFPVMLPLVFGWRNPMDDDARPRLKGWFQKVGALPAAERVRAEISEALASWESSGRFTPIMEQVAANPELQWKP
jgi:glutathione S-transferase